MSNEETRKMCLLYCADGYKDKTAIIKVDVMQTEMSIKGYVDSPANNTTVKGNYNVHGWAMDSNGVSKVYPKLIQIIKMTIQGSTLALIQTNLRMASTHWLSLRQGIVAYQQP